MSKILIKNAIIVLLQLILIVPYNYCYNYYASKLITFAYVAVILYAMICGLLFMFMNFSNKKINVVFAIYYLLFVLLNIQYPLYSYGPTVFLFVLILGELLSTIIKRKPYDL
jgi:hypothetical protein